MRPACLGEIAALTLVALLAAQPARATASPPSARTQGSHLVVGVLAYRPKPQALAAWQPLAGALEAALPGCTVRVEALGYDELERAIEARAVDLVITNPGHYVAIHSRQPMSGVLATVEEQGPQRAVAAMAGVIVVRSDRTELARLADLDHARIASVGPESLGGYQAQVYELVQAGLEVPARARVTFTGMPHDLVIEAVLAGTADAGFLRAGLLEQLVGEGRLDLGRLRVLNRQAPSGFPDAASTRLYPGWPVVALAHVDEGLARHVAAALLGIDHGPVPPLVGGYAGFTIPANYGLVETMMRDLRLPPFDGAPEFQLSDVLRRYRHPLAALAVAAALIALLAALLLRSHRRLRREHAARILLVVELRDTLGQVKTLKGLLPICMHCHKIRNDSGYWDRLEQYLSEKTGAAFSHALCPECLDRHFPAE